MFYLSAADNQSGLDSRGESSLMTGRIKIIILR